MCPVTSVDAQTICAFLDPVLFQAFFRPRVTEKSKNPVNHLWTLKSYSVFPAARLEIPVLQEHQRSLTRLWDKSVPERWKLGCLASQEHAGPCWCLLCKYCCGLSNDAFFFFFNSLRIKVPIGFIILSSDSLNCFFLKIVSSLTNTAA